jgi:hypothetical protein
MRGSPPAPTDEQSAIRSIAALIKNYEPQFDLQRSFTPGVLGCSDPQYPMARREWLRDLDRKGLTSKLPPGWESVFEDLRAETELGWQKSQPADSRINWRVTVRHGDYFIHIMALDRNFERFAFSLQSEGDLEAGLTSDCPRPDCYRYKVVNLLSELKPILDDLYEGFKRRDEGRRQQDRINKAVAAEREKWDEQLAKEREKRQQVVYFVMFIAVLFVVGAVNKHFHGVPGDVISIALGAGIGAFIGAFFDLWCLISVGLKLGLLKDGKATPLIMPSAWIVFFALWAALAYWIFKN